MQLGNKHRNQNVAMKGFTAGLLVLLIAVSSLGDQGCNIALRGTPPPPPPGAGQPAPGPTTGTTPTSPGTTTNPPTVEVITATTAEVTGYAIDTNNPTSTAAVKVDLLPGATANNTDTQPLQTGSTDANLTFTGLTQPGKGFRFTLSGPTFTTTTSIVVRATTAGGQVAMTGARTLTAPTGNTSPTQ